MKKLNQKGMTLVEVTLSIAMISIIGTFIFNFLVVSMETYQKGEQNFENLNSSYSDIEKAEHDESNKINGKIIFKVDGVETFVDIEHYSGKSEDVVWAFE